MKKDTKPAKSDILNTEGGGVILNIHAIGTDAYKVKLCKKELEKYILDYASLDPAGKETLLLLDDILEQIKIRYAKHYMLQSMLVEFFPEESGGCYLYLSPQGKDALFLPQPKIAYACFLSESDLLRYAKTVLEKDITVFLFDGMYYLPCDAEKCSSEVLSEFSQPMQLNHLSVALLLEYGEEIRVLAKKQKMQKP